MKPSRMGWGVLAVWLVALSCAAPRALSPEGQPEADVSCDAEVLESRGPGGGRPPPRPPPRPGRGGRRAERNPFGPRERVFNAEPTPEQRWAQRWRAENAAVEQTLRERYWKWKAEAERLYPGKAGLYEEHHFWPRYLGGKPDGPRFLLPAPYHQLITNAFRKMHGYGQPRPTEARAREILMEVYSEYPIPQMIGIPDP